MKRMFVTTGSPRQTMQRARRGTLMPAIAFALLVVGATIGLVLNSLWKDAAVVELRSVAEAAALAAAGEYLGDGLLQPQVDFATLTELAAQRAAEVAAANRVAGQPVILQLPIPGEPGTGDIQFGRRVETFDADESTFLLTSDRPELVEVQVRRTRQHGNPIELFLAGVTGQPYADAVSTAEVAFDNRIRHFQPSNMLAVPALPLAILADDPTGNREDTWNAAIEQRLGSDEYRYDELTRQVVRGSDGIPELELRSLPLGTTTSPARAASGVAASGMPASGMATSGGGANSVPMFGPQPPGTVLDYDSLIEAAKKEAAQTGSAPSDSSSSAAGQSADGSAEAAGIEAGNVQLLDFRNDLGEQAIISQFLSGLTAEHLTETAGVLPAVAPFETTGLSYLTTPVQEALDNLRGQQKIVCLYEQQESLNVPGWSRLICRGVVAVRIMDVISYGDESVSVIVQPTVLTTPTAVLSRFWQPEAEQSAFGSEDPLQWSEQSNSYIYKMYLNR